MADNSKIEWTDATWNPITGCSVVSPGCTNCYAMRLAGTRLAHHQSRSNLTRDTKAGPVWTGEVRFNEDWLDQPLRWKKPRMIFVCAHGDLFAEGVPDAWIDRVFAVMALAPQHTFQVLTKRSARMREYLSSWRVDADGFFTRDGGGYNSSAHLRRDRFPLPNVWLGVSVEDQKRAEERIPDLLATPAAIRWISAEPLLGQVNLHWIAVPGTNGLDALRGLTDFDEGPLRAGPRLDWIVVGGESGPGARPMHPDWARSLRDQCAAAGVPFHFKQWGNWWPRDQWEHNPDLILPDDDYVASGQAPGTCHVGTAVMHRQGKKTAGRLLDGVEHNGLPAPSPARSAP
jgi:protein gp37